MTSASRPPRVLLATCAEVAALDADDAPLVALLAARGASASPAVWTDPAAGWDEADLVVVRSTWDYYPRRDAFLAWAGGLPRVLNGAEVLAWNTDKSYLRELAAAGLPVVVTTWVGPGDAYEVPTVEHVVKPAVSGGSKDTARYRPGEEDASRAHVTALQAQERLVMVQPYLRAVDEVGETGLLFLDGRFSHAIRKGAILRPGGALVTGLYAEEAIEAREPSAAERELAEVVLDALPYPRAELLYARVDLVPGADGSPVLLELELTEPSLFLRTAPGAAERFADAIAARVRDGGGGYGRRHE